jgi:transducin beta-like protein 2
MIIAESEIKVWDGKTGKLLGAVETNQLKNNMATISPNGRFLAAAAFTADVKVFFFPSIFHVSNEKRSF